MQRTVWVQVDPWNKNLVTTALEGGASAVVVPKGCPERVRALGRIRTVAEDGDLVPGRDVEFFTITDGADEDRILQLSRDRRVVLECQDWTVIPLENLVARQADVIVRVADREAARTAFGVLEKGVRRVLYDGGDAGELKAILDLARDAGGQVELETAEVTAVVPVGMGDRVCVDTCTNMETGQGILVGNSSAALFLVHAESVENPYVAPRPFRVNAGPVHAYTRVPGGKTRYLSELAAGDPVLIADFQGRTHTAVVGRLKIEKRPLLLVQARLGEIPMTVLLQNAETIRLTRPDGRPVSVVELTAGDPVLVAAEAGGRHFGYRIEETITEK